MTEITLSQIYLKRVNKLLYFNKAGFERARRVRGFFVGAPLLKTSL